MKRKNPKSTLQYARRLLFSLSVALALSLTAPSAHAGNMSCENESGLSKVACHALMGAVFVIGGTVVAVQAAKDAVTPDMDVKVKLPSGEIIQGSLGPMAQNGRTVKSGDTVELDCSKSKALNSNQIGQWNYICEIRYIDDPIIKRKNQPLHASITEDGIPQQSLIKLERPLQWVDGKGI